MPNQVNVVLLGLGVVGGGVARAISERADTYSQRVGASLALRRVLVRHLEKEREIKVDPGLLTADPEEALSGDVDIVVELLGGEHPAYDLIKDSLSRGRYVVTANKEVMAKHGSELLALAAERGVDILYEASVGGGIPIISPLKRDLSANDISCVRAIINGTTNYILTCMSRDGLDFDTALAQAQQLGYAEADPTNDIDGHDAAYKLAILASLAFHTRVGPEEICREGIGGLAARDFRYARELGYAIKLLAVARLEDSSLQVLVHPTLVPEDELLAKVDGVLNAVEIEGDLTGRVLFQGAGAGSLPTTSAVMADVLEAARALVLGGRPFPWRYTAEVAVRPLAELVTRYYIRLEVADRPSVLAGIARAFGDHQVSIASVIQKEADEAAQTAELVVMTHPAREEAVQATLVQVRDLPDVVSVGNLLRVDG
ncbi:MAG: homoserine dehydrogenase [Chloroflexi bacterium]|nr:homoserine dehydrogenase [Chloroflexota bacterium]